MFFPVLAQFVILLANFNKSSNDPQQLVLATNYSTEASHVPKVTQIQQIKSVDEKSKPVSRRKNSIRSSMRQGMIMNVTQIQQIKSVDEKSKPVSTRKKPIRLSMRQGMIMNQVLNVYGIDDVENGLCVNHSMEFREALRAFEPWALKMIDSSSKMQSGIFMGNLMEFGSFKQCINIESETPSGIVKGKHCTLKITPPLNLIKKMLSFRNISPRRFEKIKPMMEHAGMFWSVCIPASCTTEDVLRHFSKNIENVGDGLNLSVSLTKMDCYSLEDEPRLTKNHYVIISVFLGIIGISLLCTLKDVCSNKENEAEQWLIVDILSTYKNAKYIFSVHSNDRLGLGCLHGVRFLSACYVVLGHSYMMSLFAPTVNSLEVMEWLLKYTSTIIIGGTVSVDSFFLLAGCLVCYNVLDALNATNGKVNWIFFYVYRFIRLTPPYALAVLVYADLIQFIGSGPLWRRMSGALQKPCQYFWWSAILNIQGYTNPKHMCIVHSWYLTDDFFFYLVSPVLVYPLWKWNVLGWINIFATYIFSVLLNFYLAWVNRYGAGMLVTNRLIQTKYFTQYYIVPHARASTYILGIILGGLLQKTKDKKYDLHPVTVTFGWMWCAVLMLSVILGNHTFQLENHVDNRLETALYLTLSRSSWTIGLMWVIWACKQGYGGPVNYFLSNSAFQVLGKLSYSIFIWHLPLQFLSVGALKLPLYFADYNMINKFISDIWTVILFSVFYTILFECPCVRLVQHFKHKSKRISDNTQ